MKKVMALLLTLAFVPLLAAPAQAAITPLLIKDANGNEWGKIINIELWTTGNHSLTPDHETQDSELGNDIGIGIRQARITFSNTLAVARNELFYSTSNSFISAADFPPIAPTYTFPITSVDGLYFFDAFGNLIIGISCESTPGKVTIIYPPKPPDPDSDPDPDPNPNRISEEFSSGSSFPKSTPDCGEPAKIGRCKEWVNVRSGPGENYDVIGRAYLNESIGLQQWNKDETWCKVFYDDCNRLGWVYHKYIIPLK